MLTKEFGKITHAQFGYGGYQDVQFGLSLAFQGPGFGTGHFDGFWADEPSESADWTEDQQREALGRTTLNMVKLFRQAKVKNVSGLVGKPVEVSFDGSRMIDWRILEEVL